MGQLCVVIVMLLKLVLSSFIKPPCLSPIGLMHFKLKYTLLIVCPSPLLETYHPTLLFLVNLLTIINFVSSTSQSVAHAAPIASASYPSSCSPSNETCPLMPNPSPASPSSSPSPPLLPPPPPTNHHSMITRNTFMSLPNTLSLRL
ncbi:hypothetical protein GBA52_010190 [Prunus armeniaca]|nr:hypothetical protein GBA52_010190 [Prunus armeniaca]